MIKVGDKLYCKKRRGDTLSHVLKGKSYIIEWIGNIDVDVIGETGKVVTFSKETREGYHNLSDYFYTQKELINLKLKKIKIM